MINRIKLLEDLEKDLELASNDAERMYLELMILQLEKEEEE